MKTIAAWTLALGICAVSWIGAFYSARFAYRTYQRFMAKCASDVQLSKNTGRIAAALERHERRHR